MAFRVQTGWQKVVTLGRSVPANWRVQSQYCNATGPCNLRFGRPSAKEVLIKFNLTLRIRATRATQSLELASVLKTLEPAGGEAGLIPVDAAATRIGLGQDHSFLPSKRLAAIASAVLFSSFAL